MRSKSCLLLSSYLAAIMAMPLPQALGQQPSADESSPTGISDWALAGVVWSDASLARRLAVDALREAQSEGAASPTQESLQQLAQQSQTVIKALEQFGWAHKQAAAPDAVPAADTTATELPPTSAPTQTNESPSTKEIMTEKIKAAEAVGNAEAAAADPLTPLPTLSNRVSERDSQTLSDTLPYAAGSIYDHGDYEPGGNYLSDAPMPVDSSRVYSSELGEIEGEVNREATRRRANAQRKQDSKPKVDPRVTAGLLRRIQMDDYTTAPEPETAGSGDHADARWVQFRLEANQWTYSRVSATERISAARAALRQLQATAMTAGKSTQDEQLKQILAPIMKLSL